MIRFIQKLKLLHTAIALLLWIPSAIAQTGPAGIGTYEQNVLWLRADQGTSTTTNEATIESWNDISGNNNHANQTTEGKRPQYIESSINSLPAIRFSGTDVNFVVDDNDNLDNTSGLSIFVVGQPENIDTNPRGLVSKRVNNSTERAYSMFIGYTGTSIYFDTPSRLNGTANAVDNTPQIFTGVYNGAATSDNSSLFINANTIVTGSTGNTTIESTNSDLYIGILNDNYGNAFRGDMSEVLIYRSALNQAERLIVEAYLANRYDIDLGAVGYSSTTHTHDMVGIGHANGDKYSATQGVGSGLLLAESNGSLDEDYEFVFAGHDNTAHAFDNTDLPTIPDVTLDNRWERVYYVERVQDGTIDAGTTSIRLGFDFDEASLTPHSGRVYYLLYREANSGEFSAVPGGLGVSTNGKVWFNISNANFASGYYTIARSNQEVRTWYSFNDGNWTDWERWSMDPDVFDNVGEEIPGVMDRVVIQNNKQISVTSSGVSAGVLEVNAGIIDFGTTTGNTFSSITGQPEGIIRLAADNFPDGDATGFADPSSGGTVEYYGGSYELTTPRTFRYMEVNLDNAANQLTLLADYSLNGNLDIKRGELHFGNASSTTDLNLTVSEHLEVSANGKIRTGTGNARHQLNLYGNLTNRGDIQLTNRSSATYGSEADNGIVDANFRSAIRNQNLMLHGPARFYRIAIEKGLTNTYELYMEADDETYFNLFGYAGQGHPQNEQLTTNNNALGLAYGTVRIGPNITIERLNQGGNYNVSENAVLWVDGGSVTKPSGTGEAVVVYGRVKVSDGYFASHAPSGITSRNNGVFESTGGTTELTQFRTSVYGAQHIGGFIMEDGDVTINGHNANNNYYSFSLSYEGNVFILTGGTLTVNGTNTTGAIFINSDPVNQNVSASATMNLVANSTRTFRITSRAPLPTVNFERDDTGERNFVLEGGSVGTNPSNQAELPALPLVTKGTLTLNANISFNPNGQDVTIGRSYIIYSGASYTAGSNTTTFEGATANYSIFIHSGASTKYFHNLTINNPGRTGTLSTSDITVGNNLNITAGTLGSGVRNITVRGDIINSGTITNTTGKILVTDRGRVHTIALTDGGSYTTVPDVNIAAPADGTQATAVAVFNGTPAVGNPLPIDRIVITNTGSGYTAAPTVTFSEGDAAGTAVIGTTHAIGGDGTGVFGNLEVDEEHPSDLSTEVTYLTAKQTVTGTMTLTDGILDLRTHNLDIEGILASETITDYSNSRMFRTEGNHGDGGLTRTISADGTYLFPIGSINYDEDAYRYAWANPSFSDVQDAGKVQINGVPRNLPTLGDENPKRYLYYYWRVRYSGFTANPYIHNQFLSYEDDYTSPFNFNNAVTGKVIGLVRYPSEVETDDEWGTLDNLGGGLRLLNYERADNNPTPLEEGEFTSAFKPFFNGTIRVFYSRTTANSWYNDWWDDSNNWSFDPHNGSNPDDRTPAGDYPSTGDIAIIGYGGHNDRGGYHSVNIRNFVEVGKIEFVPHPNPPADARISRVVINQNGTNDGTLDAGIVEGPGVFQVYNYDTGVGNFPSINADFSEFNQEESSVFLFYPSGGGFHIIPNISGGIFPNLRLEGGAATMDYDFIVRNNFTIDGNGEFITNAGDNGDFSVLGNLLLGDYNSGTLSFSSTHERTVELGGIKFNVGTSVGNTRMVRVLNDSPNNLRHKLIVNGDIIKEDVHDNSIELFTDNIGGNNVILEFAGSGNSTFEDIYHSSYPGTSTPNLYQLVINKDNTTDQVIINSRVTIGGDTDTGSDEKSVQLSSGRLVLNNEHIDIDLSTGGGDFFIPSTAGLVVQNGQVNVHGDNTGILLDGLLRVETGGTVEMGDPDGLGNGNNYIEYSASGSATIEVTGGTLTVGSQVRRGTSNPSGVLRYWQTGGTVTIGKNAAPVSNRGVFEVINSGSRFIHQAGTLTIARANGSSPATDEASILIEPALSLVNSTLTIGNNNTPASSIITLKTNIALRNLNLNDHNDPTLRLKDRSLTLNGNLTIGDGATFDGNENFNLTLAGTLTNNGTAWLNTDTLFLVGASQVIDGEITARDVVVEPSASVTLEPNSDMEVQGDLILNAAQFVDGGNTITLLKDVRNNAAHVSSSTNQGGLRFAGSSTQRIFGTGQFFGRIEVDNPTRVQLEGDMYFNNHLTLTNGLFHVQHYGLILGEDAEVLTPTEFNSDRMIAVFGGAFTPKGVTKQLPTVVNGTPTDPYDPNDPGYTHHILFPLGTDNGTTRNYAPMELHIASNASNGSISLVPVSDKHLTFTEPDQENNVLHQYWEVTSNGIANFTALQRFLYNQDAVNGQEDEYIGARLFENQWAKFANSDDPPILVVDDANNLINFIHSTVDNISGDYTAGHPDYIPDEVPIYYSVQNGNWTEASTWERGDGGTVPTGGPVGQRVHIRSNHTVTMNSNYRRSYETTINGRLNLGSTINHILGYVRGTGTLALESNSVPTGNYTDFLDCGGGTMEYGGTGTYTLSDRFLHYNNLTLAGSGTKSLPSDDMTICGNLSVIGSAEAVVRNHIPVANRNIIVTGNLLIETDAKIRSHTQTTFNLYGDLIKEGNGGYDHEAASVLTKLIGTNPQNVDGDFTPTNKRFNNLEVNNASGMLVEGNADIINYLDLNNGTYDNSGYYLKLLRTNGLRTNAANSYIGGRVRRVLGSAAGTDNINHTFPVGDATKKNTFLLSPSVAGQEWDVEYFGSSALNSGANPANFNNPIEMVSGSEHWIINGPNSQSATIRFTLTGTSEIAAILGNTNINSLRIARWDATAEEWFVVGNGASISGTIDNGTITTTDPVTFSGDDQIFTLVSVQLVEAPTARFLTSDQSICNGETVSLTIELAGTPNWTVEYEVYDGTSTTTETISGIGTQPHSFDVSPTVTTTYTLTDVSDEGGAPEGIIWGSHIVTVTVFNNPTIFNVFGGGAVCGGITATVGLDDSEVGFTYVLYRDGNPHGMQLAGTGDTLLFENIDAEGDYTISAYNSNRPACEEWMTGTATVFLGSEATAEITGLVTPANICHGDPVTLQITFNGSPPFTFSLQDNKGNSWPDVEVTEAQLTGNNPYTFNYTINPAPEWDPNDVPPPTAYTYTLTSIEDDSPCGEGLILGTSVEVNVFKVPTTGAVYHIPNDFGM